MIKSKYTMIMLKLIEAKRDSEIEKPISYQFPVEI